MHLWSVFIQNSPSFVVLTTEWNFRLARSAMYMYVEITGMHIPAFEILFSFVKQKLLNGDGLFFFLL